MLQRTKQEAEKGEGTERRGKVLQERTRARDCNQCGLRTTNNTGKIEIKSRESKGHWRSMVWCYEGWKTDEQVWWSITGETLSNHLLKRTSIHGGLAISAILGEGWHILWCGQRQIKPLSLSVYVRVVADEASGSMHKQTHSSLWQGRGQTNERGAGGERERRVKKQRER